MPRLKRLCRVLTSALPLAAALASSVGAPLAQDDDESAEEVFRAHISGPVVRSKCVNCHVAGGVSGHTRLVFVQAPARNTIRERSSLRLPRWAFRRQSQSVSHNSVASRCNA